MSKRTLTKIIRSHDAIPSHKEKVNGKMVQKYNYVKRAVPFPPLPLEDVEVKCAKHGSHMVRASAGQSFNPLKVCKRASTN